MTNLTSVPTIKAILAQAGLHPQKALGQNFLVSDQVLRNFINACELKSGDFVIEVGAGLGTITTQLALQARKTIAVEIDQDFLPILDKNLAAVGNLNVIVMDNDILKDTAWQQIEAGLDANQNSGAKTQFKVVGAIPYQITSPLLHRIFFSKRLPNLACFIVQKEVAGKITARPPRGSYFSNLTALFGEAKIVGRTISPAAFWPQPKVESAILKIQFNKGAPKIPVKKFSKFLHLGFSQPRKMLRSVFYEGDLLRAKLKPQKRAQELELKEWLCLWEIWKKQKP